MPMMLLLFEIVRRLVKYDQVPGIIGEKKALDNLSISGAITKIVNLMKARSRTFEEVFIRRQERENSRENFCFFPGSAEEKRQAIDRMSITRCRDQKNV